MQNEVIKSNETLKRIRDFGESRRAEIPASSPVGQMFAEVDAAIDDLARHASAQAASTSGARAGSATKARLRATLLDNVRAINRAGQAAAEDHPNLQKKFRLPPAGDEN